MELGEQPQYCSERVLFDVHEGGAKLPRETDSNRPVPAETLERLGSEIAKAQYPAEYPVVICNCSLEEDLFSSFDGKVAVISTHGWTRKFSRHPVERYLAYTLTDVLMNLSDVETPVHYKTRGCIGDYCDKRSDINVGLDRCDYCLDCRSLIRTAVTKRSISVAKLAAIYRILDFAADRQTCFVVMPFAKKFDAVYERCLAPTLAELGWVCGRADRKSDPGEIMELVWEEIQRSKLIIADLTSNNANVFYELGYAHALGKYTLLITQSTKEVPFDLRQQRIVEYSATPNGYRKLTASIRKYLQSG